MNRLVILAAAGILAATPAFAGNYDSSTGKKSASEYKQTEGVNSYGQDKSQQGQRTGQTNLLQQTSADQIVGMDVIDAQGNEVGHVEKVVRDNASKTHLVIEVDEWDIGDKKVVVAADHLSMDADNEKLRTALSKESLKSQPKYDESRYFDFDEEEVEAE